MKCRGIREKCSLRCCLSTLEIRFDLLTFWLDVEWDPKSAAHSCIAVNWMTTCGLGNRVKLYRRIQGTLSFSDSTLTNSTSLQREVSKTHAAFQIDYWTLRDTSNLRF